MLSLPDTAWPPLSLDSARIGEGPTILDIQSTVAAQNDKITQLTFCFLGSRLLFSVVHAQLNRTTGVCGCSTGFVKQGNNTCILVVAPSSSVNAPAAPLPSQSPSSVTVSPIVYMGYAVMNVTAHNGVVAANQQFVAAAGAHTKQKRQVYVCLCSLLSVDTHSSRLFMTVIDPRSMHSFSQATSVRQPPSIYPTARLGQ